MKSKQIIPIILVCVAVAVAVFDACNLPDRRHLYAVGTEKCIGCRKCLSVCPQDAITLTDGKAVIDKRKCIGCGRCLRVCPASAIYPVPE